MATIPAAAAPETDRLVLGVNEARDQDRIARLAADVGLDSWHVLGHWWDFLLAGTLTREVARLRSRYAPVQFVDGMVDRLLTLGLVDEQSGRLAGTTRLEPALSAIRDDTRRVARDAWAGHEHQVDVVASGATRIIAAADEDATVAVAHRAIALPDDKYLALYCRLVTVRYIRQHDHAAAWAAHDLTASQMRVYTELWHGGQVADDVDGRADLEARGLVVPGGGLTDAGQLQREQIERETLERSARTYGVLGEDGPEYLAALTALPTPPG
jgi:hypothetical protein